MIPGKSAAVSIDGQAPRSSGTPVLRSSRRPLASPAVYSKEVLLGIRRGSIPPIQRRIERTYFRAIELRRSG